MTMNKKDVAYVRAGRRVRMAESLCFKCRLYNECADKRDKTGWFLECIAMDALRRLLTKLSYLEVEHGIQLSYYESVRTIWLRNILLADHVEPIMMSCEQDEHCTPNLLMLLIDSRKLPFTVKRDVDDDNNFDSIEEYFGQLLHRYVVYLSESDRELAEELQREYLRMSLDERVVLWGNIWRRECGE